MEALIESQFFLIGFAFILMDIMAALMLYMLAMIHFSKITVNIPPEKLIRLKQLKIKDNLDVGIFKSGYQSLFSVNDTLTRVLNNPEIKPYVDEDLYKAFVKKYAIAKLGFKIMLGSIIIVALIILVSL